MGGASMIYISWKMAFLLLWGTACRRSELHALDFKTFAKASERLYVELYIAPEFRAKFQHLDKDPSASRVYILKRLDAPSGVDAHSGTTHLLGSNENVWDRRRRPFHSTNPKIRDIVANTVSSWIKSTVIQAYSPSGDFAQDEQLRKTYEIGPDEVANLHHPAHEARAQGLHTDPGQPTVPCLPLKACYY